jgi:glycosyltransferase involved in cell wall biosynthesis
MPVVVHFHGPWAQESAAAGETGRLRLGIKRELERWVYHRAEAVVTLSSAFKRLIVNKYGTPPWCVHVVPPGVDTETFTPGDRDAARDELDIPRSAWVRYAYGA